MSKIAICLRGSMRTWDACKLNIVDFFDFPNDEVTWFIDTWDVDTYSFYHLTHQGEIKSSEKRSEVLNQESLNESLNGFFTAQGRNLGGIKYHSFDSKLNASKSFLKLIYLSNLSKREYEVRNNFKFDIVIQIRPDIIFTQNIFDLKQFYHSCIHESEHNNILNYQIREDRSFESFSKFLLNNPFETHAADVPAIPDFVFYGNSFVIDVLSFAYLTVKDHEFCYPHASLFNHLAKYGMIIDKDSIHCHIVRNMIIDGSYEYNLLLASNASRFSDHDMYLPGILKCEEVWYTLQR